MGVSRYFFGSASFRVRCELLLMRWFKDKGLITLARIVSNRLQSRFGIFVSPNVEFSVAPILPHPTSIVIGDRVQLGDNVIIYQNVTIGGARIGDAGKGLYPRIGEGAVIFSGAVIIGPITVGKNCIIGANSVVINDVPDNCTVAGVPARIISEEKND